MILRLYATAMFLATNRNGWVLAAPFLAVFLVAVVAAADNGVQLAEVRVKPGFHLELVYRVPTSQGSWVCLTCDSRGRLIASDESGKLYLIEPAPVGRSTDDSLVQPLPLDIGEAQGLACVQDDLYVVVNSSSKRWKSGLHRARDADGDGLWETIELLRELHGGGEHGPHAVIPDVDGKSLLVCCGNHTDPTAFESGRMPRIGPEDVVLAHLSSPTAFQATRCKPPGGWIARTDLDGGRWKIVSCGYRNQYDIVLNRDGELFTYDSDMEYDIGMPWYRPTRVCHVTSGSDYGWRHNSGPFPHYYPDTLPPVAELGPGSPTGLAFGYETSFSAPYREALFAADWGRGVIHSLQLEPSGASYTAVTDALVRATPLPVTDLAVNPTDGALYFTTGGRGIESAVYRLVYAGEQSARAESPSRLGDDSDSAATARLLRRRLESLQRLDSTAIATAWPMLDHSDRFIRHAARIAVEHQPLSGWGPAAVLHEPAAGRRTAASLALVRADPAVAPATIVEALSSLNWMALGQTERRECLRAYEILLARHGPLLAEEAARISDQLLEHFPEVDASTTRMLATVLTRLGDPKVTPGIVNQFEQTLVDEDRIHLAHALCDVTVGWTPQLRKTYFELLAELIERHRNASLRPYLDQIAARSLELAPSSDRETFGRQIAEAQVHEKLAAIDARPFVQRWTVDQAVEALGKSTRSPDLARGERLFAEASCITCHQIQRRGGAVGPDLSTLANRFSLRDLLTAIVDPDQTISDQYQQTTFEIAGRVLIGRIVDQRGKQVRIATDMTDPKRGEFVQLHEIDAQAPSEVSPMPRGLVDTMSAEELADLVGFLRAG
ncbi:MAG: c-type cytochrome [Pirellulales bacterium]|nr:c-type cytochrome [Pirellulales bacterium]